MSEHNATTAITLLSEKLDSLQRRAAEQWKGRESEAIIALVRALDTVAVVNTVEYIDDTPDGARQRSARLHVLHGAACALQPFLSAVRSHKGEPLRWPPFEQEAIQFAYPYLQACGELSHLLRLALLERDGLTSSHMKDGKLVIKTKGGAAEFASFYSRQDQSTSLSEPLPGGEHANREQRRLRRKMFEYVDCDYGLNWFIRYNNDIKIVNAYRRRAREYAKRFFEGEALRGDAFIAGRTFGEWRTSCEHALGRALCHIDFCLLLKKKRPHVHLSEVLTIFVRREDAEAVWREAGLQQDAITPTMHALTLDADRAAQFKRAFEVPCSFYVDIGGDFLLLPCFGALANPYYALFRHLRSTHTDEWSTQSNLREGDFREDIMRAFPSPRYLVPPHGFNLKRDDGSTLTDIDAVILDTETGTLAIIQLKWHDIYGRSLSERDSRQKNICKANTWIASVSSWIGDRSSGEIAEHWGLEGTRSAKPPMLYVVARYTARFSGDQPQDSRAAWLGWYEILAAMARMTSEAPLDPLAEIPLRVYEFEASFKSTTERVFNYRFDDITVDVHIC